MKKRGAAVGVWAILVAAAAFPCSVQADSGDRQFEIAGGYRTSEAADLLFGGTLGLGDFTFARGRTGLRLDDDQLTARLEASAGYLFDVLTWVPEISAGAAIDIDDVDIVLTALAFLGVRYYVGLDSFVAFEAGGELDPDGLGALFRVSYAF
ncbi:MAG: hypothetical protein AAF654_09465 [Myxococcota bacterium]